MSDYEKIAIAIMALVPLTILMKKYFDKHDDWKNPGDRE